MSSPSILLDAGRIGSEFQRNGESNVRNERKNDEGITGYSKSHSGGETPEDDSRASFFLSLDSCHILSAVAFAFLFASFRRSFDRNYTSKNFCDLKWLRARAIVRTTRTILATICCSLAGCRFLATRILLPAFPSLFASRVGKPPRFEEGFARHRRPL